MLHPDLVNKTAISNLVGTLTSWYSDDGKLNFKSSVKVFSNNSFSIAFVTLNEVLRWFGNVDGMSMDRVKKHICDARYVDEKKDITLNDFANSRYSTGKTRIKKAATNNVVREVKELSTHTDTRAWYDKLEDYEGDFEFVEEEDEDGERAVVMKKAPRRRKKTISEDQSINIGGIDYPLDVWFLISEHIRPEDVSVFAGICKSALHVTNTAKFWFHLYKRHYRSVPNLPERLQPECMVRLYGLRTCVIRALHFMYPPFVNKVKAITTFEEDPHVLTKRQCVLMWIKKCKNQWLFFFKLKQSRFVIGRGPSIKAKQPDLLEMLEDVSSNHDEGCKVLQRAVLSLTCPSGGLVPRHLARPSSSGRFSNCSLLQTTAQKYERGGEG
uniref:Transmembrane protein 183 n=1 Tax=Timema cristinae TaxID=61476 RepID=A0A7R9GZB7_TIMCR|nr:unnamed protein product [Timema cristinae]